MFDTTNKIIVSRNVAFKEDREWDWKIFEGETKLNWEENIEIDENTTEKGEITKETTERVVETIELVAENEGEITEETTRMIAETIEPVAQNNFLVAVVPDLTIREGRNRHPPVWLADYNYGEGLFEEDENMTFLMIKILWILRKLSKAKNGDWLWIKKSNPLKTNQTKRLWEKWKWGDVVKTTQGFLRIKINT